MNHGDTEVRDQRPNSTKLEQAVSVLLHVSHITHVPYPAILARSRKPRVVWARSLAMDGMYRRLRWSTRRVGWVFARPGSDVVRARRRVAQVPPGADTAREAQSVAALIHGGGDE